jgi:hypothetical protein
VDQKTGKKQMSAKKKFIAEHSHITDAAFADLKMAIGEAWSTLDADAKLARLKEEYERRPHLQPIIVEKNPWSPEFWNVSAQGATAVALGVTKANEIAAQVGSKIGQTHPNPDFARGEQEKKSAADKRRKDHSKNPFHRSAWNISGQGTLVKSIGLEKANEIARTVGSHVGATRANPDY